MQISDFILMVAMLLRLNIHYTFLVRVMVAKGLQKGSRFLTLVFLGLKWGYLVSSSVSPCKLLFCFIMELATILVHTSITSAKH